MIGKGIFITGTDTDVGKTVATTLIGDVPLNLEQLDNNFLEDLDVDLLNKVFPTDNTGSENEYRPQEAANVYSRELLVATEGTREFEYEIPESDANIMISKLSVIRKTRHRIDDEVGGYTLDYFLGNLEGLVLVEKEFASEELAASEEIPSWLEDCPEVTGDPSYINANLGTAMFVAGVGLVDSDNLQTGDDEEPFVDPNFLQL